MFSYPMFDVDIVRELTPERLRWPESGAARNESGLGGNRSYIDLRRLSWKEAKRVYDHETELIHRLEEAEDVEQEYDAIEDELYEDPEGILGLDVGVASTVAALSAAHSVPFASCNGGCFGGLHHECYPVVAFYARSEMAPHLLEAAEVAGIGLTTEDEGAVVAFASDIRHMRSFAMALMDRHDVFRNQRAPRPRQQHERRRAHHQPKLL